MPINTCTIFNKSLNGKIDVNLCFSIFVLILHFDVSRRENGFFDVQFRRKTAFSFYRKMKGRDSGKEERDGWKVISR